MTAQSSISTVGDFLVGTARGMICWVLPLALLSLLTPFGWLLLVFFLVAPGLAGGAILILIVSAFVGFTQWNGNATQSVGLVLRPIALGIAMLVIMPHLPSGPPMGIGL